MRRDCKRERLRRLSEKAAFKLGKAHWMLLL